MWLVLPRVGSRWISQMVNSARNLVTWSNIWSIFLAAARQLCYMIFTGKYGNINFKMKNAYIYLMKIRIFIQLHR